MTYHLRKEYSDGWFLVCGMGMLSKGSVTQKPVACIGETVFTSVLKSCRPCRRLYSLLESQNTFVYPYAVSGKVCIHDRIERAYQQTPEL